MVERRAIAIDIEATKIPFFHPWQSQASLCSVGVAYADGTTKTWLFNHKYEPIRNHKTMIAEIQAEINANDIIVAHNLKYDIHWLWYLGLDLSNKTLWCTQLADYTINGQRKLGYSLNAVAERYGLGQKEDKMAEYWNNGYNTPDIPLSIHIPYLKQDCLLTMQIYEAQKPRMEACKLEVVFQTGMQVLDILAKMEYRGFIFDKELALKYVEQYTELKLTLEAELKALVGFDLNVGSGDQLSVALYGGNIKVSDEETYHRIFKSGKISIRNRKIVREEYRRGLAFTPIKGSEKAKAGYYQTNKDTLVQLKARTPEQSRVLEILKDYSKAKKIVETLQSPRDENKGLIALVQDDGRIHPTFNQTVTSTGRLSSSNPNGQNIPPAIKTCILPEHGKIANGDLAQVEFRIAATTSGDPVMVTEIINGLDVHTDNAEKFLGAVKGTDSFKYLRGTAKGITFQALFGGSAFAFFKNPNMPNYPLKRWEEIHKQYYAKYTRLKEWQDDNMETVTKQGYLRSPSGRVLGFTKAQKKDGSYGYKRTQVCNYPIQSGAADLMYICMIEITKRTEAQGFKAVPILQVHDSFVFDTPEEEVIPLCEIMMEVFDTLPELAKQYYGWDIVVPLTGDCEVGDNYKAARRFTQCADCNEWFYPEKEDELEADVFVCKACQDKRKI